MDISKKRKADENGTSFATNPTPPSPNPHLTPQDARKIIDPFTKDQLLQILQNAVVRDPAALADVRSIADSDITHRKLFVRGLGWETTTDKIRSIFSAFGEIVEAIVINDKVTGKSKGYGFVTFKHIDGAIVALKEPNKKIDGRITVAQLAANGNPNGLGIDVSMRKIYVGNVPFEISSERLLGHFSAYGEIEEGPLGFDKQAGKVKGFAFFVYKTEEGARASLVDPMKNIDGHQVVCKLATDGKKGKPAGPVSGDVGGDGVSVPQPGAMNSNYGVLGGAAPYGGFSGGPPSLARLNQPLNTPMPSSVGAAGFGNQGPAAFGGTGGYGGGLSGGAYGAGSQYGGSAMGDYGGLNNLTYNRMGLGSGGRGPGGYPDGGNYGSAYPSRLHQQPSSGPSRVPPGGMFHGMPPYY